MDPYRQGSLHSNPNARNSMNTHGGSERRPNNPPSGGGGGGGLQRQQLMSSSTRVPPPARSEYPQQHHPNNNVNNPPSRQDKRVLPIGGPVHISHRGSVDVSQQPQPSSQRPNSNFNPRASLLKRQCEIDEDYHEPSAAVHNPGHRGSGSSADGVGGGGHHGGRHLSKGSVPSYSAIHRHSGSHEPLSARNSGESGHHHNLSHSGSHHGRGGSGHGGHGHGQHMLIHSDSTHGKYSDKYKERERAHMEDEMLKRAREKQQENIRKEIRKEKRIMLSFTTVAFFVGILWFIAVCISYWYHVYADENSLKLAMAGGSGIQTPTTTTATNKNSTTPKPVIMDTLNDLFISSHVGIWRVCRTKRYIPSGNEKILCYWHNMFPSEEELPTLQYTDKYIVDYQRTEASFAIISLIIMALSVPAALYTLQNSRYMFKRLAAGLYFFSAATILVVLEVTKAKIDHESTKPYLRPPKSTVSYGFCFWVGWFVFSVNLITACVYLIFSRKRKGENALDDESEEEIIRR